MLFMITEVSSMLQFPCIIVWVRARTAIGESDHGDLPPVEQDALQHLRVTDPIWDPAAKTHDMPSSCRYFWDTHQAREKLFLPRCPGCRFGHIRQARHS